MMIKNVVKAFNQATRKLHFLMLLVAAYASAQVNIASTGSYSQNFDTLSSTTAAVPAWTNNSTLANWYAGQSSGTLSTYRVGTGSDNTGAMYSFGPTSNVDRALGSVASGGPGAIAYGLLLQNTSGATLTTMTVAYTGEQWRRADNTTAQTLTFWYKVSATPITSADAGSNAGWTAVSALNFTGPQTSTTASAISGNLPANRVVFAATAIPSLSVPNNSYIMIRWADSDDTGTDHGLSVDDLTVSWTTCTASTISSVTPTSGPVGTEVTVNGSGLSGATATFNGVAATVVSTSATQMVIKVPASATTGNLVVTNASSCVSTPVAFTVIDKDLTSCEGTSNFTDIIISEIYDETAGSAGVIELYNPTAAAINLMTNDYRLRRYTDSATPITTLDFPSIVVPAGGTVLVTAVGTESALCTGLTYVATLGSGFNDNDRFELVKFGTTVIDVAYGASVVGYSVLRNTTASGPTTTYNSADWTIVNSPVCTDLGNFNAINKYPPTVTTQPTVAISCTTTSVTLSVAATEGYTGGLPLAYQWYYSAPGDTGWTAVANGGIYSGATSASLAISSLATVNNYQYYCQIRENAATCYSASNAVQIKDKYSTTWTTAWSNGTPSLTVRAIIDGTYNTTTNGDFEACSLTVNAGKALTITANHYVAVQNDITVTATGTLTVADDGSLVQISNSGVNTGSIIAQRSVDMKKYDYVYWSSPVSSFAVTSVSPGTATNFIYQWQPTVSGNFGTWSNANENMVAGKGYIIRGEAAAPTTLSTFSTAFTGVPQNGIINRGISRGSYQGANYTNPANGMTVTKEDDNWNLIGNPYPSALNALAFLTANTNIEGAVRLWTHGTLPSTAVSDPFYGNFQYNYNSADYIVYNGTGTLSGPTGFNGNIASAQAFFVLMVDGAAGTQNVTFNNAMRNKNYANNQFYRPDGVQGTRAQGNDDAGRAWLDLVSESGAVNRTLVGYVEGATLAKDRMFDAYGKLDDSQNFYSLIDQEVMAIQGRPLPFDQEDRVPLGVHLTVAGSYKIAVSAVDGFFSQGTDLYLEDQLLGTVHNLKVAPYDFTADAGTLNNRFVLRFTNGTLSTPSFETQNGVAVATGEKISVNSYGSAIGRVEIFDLLGRSLYARDAQSANEFEASGFQRQQQPMLVKVTLVNGASVTRKIIF